MDIKVARVILSKLVGESDSIPAVEAMVSIFKALDEPAQQSTNTARDEICPLWKQAMLCAWPKCNRLCGVSPCTNQRGKLSPVA